MTHCKWKRNNCEIRNRMLKLHYDDILKENRANQSNDVLLMWICVYCRVCVLFSGTQNRFYKMPHAHTRSHNSASVKISLSIKIEGQTRHGTIIGGVFRRIWNHSAVSLGNHMSVGL